MQVQEIKDYCMSKPLAYEDCPLVQQPYWNTVFSKFSKKEQIRLIEEL